MNDLRFLTLDRLRELIREIVLEILEQYPNPTRSPRQGWTEQFRAANADDPGLLDQDNLGQTTWDETEWEW